MDCFLLQTTFPTFSFNFGLSSEVTGFTLTFGTFKILLHALFAGTASWSGAMRNLNALSAEHQLPTQAWFVYIIQTFDTIYHPLYTSFLFIIARDKIIPPLI